MKNKIEETKINAKRLIEMLMEDEPYENAQFIVITETYKRIYQEDIKSVSYRTMKALEQYEVVAWLTDWKEGKKQINTLIIIVK